MSCCSTENRKRNQYLKERNLRFGFSHTQFLDFDVTKIFGKELCQKSKLSHKNRNGLKKAKNMLSVTLFHIPFQKNHDQLCKQWKSMFERTEVE